MLNVNSILLRLEKLDECIARMYQYLQEDLTYLTQFQAFALALIEGTQRNRDGIT